MSKSLAILSLSIFAGLTACTTIAAQPEPSTLTQQASSSAAPATSNADFSTTNARLKAAIESRGLTLFNTVDHATGAANVGLDLAPNTLYIFGNPKAGTPLINANPVLGLHLPLKAQVYEANGTVYVNVSDIRTITATAGVTEPAPVINKIAETLSAIQADAAGG